MMLYCQGDDDWGRYQGTGGDCGQSGECWACTLFFTAMALGVLALAALAWWGLR